MLGDKETIICKKFQTINFNVISLSVIYRTLITTLPDSVNECQAKHRILMDCRRNTKEYLRMVLWNRGPNCHPENVKTSKKEIIKPIPRRFPIEKSFITTHISAFSAVIRFSLIYLFRAKSCQSR